MMEVTMRLRMPDNWVKDIGKILRLDYVSDKWHKGQDTYYWHPIESHPPILAEDENGNLHCKGIQEAKAEGLVETVGKFHKTGQNRQH